MLYLAAAVGHGWNRTVRTTVSQLLQAVIRHHHLLRRRQPTIAVVCSQARERRRITLHMRAACRLLPVWKSFRLRVGGHGKR